MLYLNAATIKLAHNQLPAVTIQPGKSKTIITPPSLANTQILPVDHSQSGKKKQKRQAKLNCKITGGL